MSRLSQMLLNEQARRGLSDREAALDMGVLQQTFSAWKGGSTPRPNRYAVVAKWLGISLDMMQELAEEAKVSTGNTILPKAREYGRVSDRKEGKFKFDPVNAGRKRIPEGRYIVAVDTKVMEPALLVGTKIWLDPSIWPQPGNDVMVYAKGGIAWLGRLEALSDEVAEISQYAYEEKLSIKDVQAVHVVVLAARIKS